MQAARRCLLAFLCAFIKGAMAILRAASLNASTKDTTMVKTEIGASDRGIGLCEGIKQRRTYIRKHDSERQVSSIELFGVQAENRGHSGEMELSNGVSNAGWG